MKYTLTEEEWYPFLELSSCKKRAIYEIELDKKTHKKIVTAFKGINWAQCYLWEHKINIDDQRHWIGHE